MITFIADGDDDFRKQLAKFCFNYPTFKDILKIDPLVITKLNKSNDVIQFIFLQQEDIKTKSTEFTSYKNLLRNGNKDEVLTAFPVLSVYPAIQPPSAMQMWKVNLGM